MAMPSTATSWVAANALMTKPIAMSGVSESKAEISRGRQRHEGKSQPALRRHDPRSPKTHRQELEPVHERAGDQLEPPWCRYEPCEPGQVADRRALLRKPCGNGDGQQPDGDALGEVERAERTESQPALFTQDQGHLWAKLVVAREYIDALARARCAR